MSPRLWWPLLSCVVVMSCTTAKPTCPGYDDGNPCTDDLCVGAKASHIPKDEGTACETGVCNASGFCLACLTNADCTAPETCAPLSGTCGLDNSACSDGVRDGNESDVDCGGSCAPSRQCSTGLHCAAPVDCKSGVCTAGVCGAGACGDGVQQDGEGCDDGNHADGDGCDDGPGSRCQPTGCGNGTKSASEACDDGNAVNGDGCDSNCTVSACGNGVPAGTEQCDDGNTRSSDGCSSSCRVEAGWMCAMTPSVCTSSCGDGAVNNGEQCDDGNRIGGDGCSMNCYRETGFTCAGAPSVCAATCGDGLRTPAEPCDDGNTGANDGCSATCTIEAGFSCNGSPSICAPTCGDGIAHAPETCDDGNAVNGDGCSNACRAEAGYVCTGSPSICSGNCGDGVRQGVETCDDGNATANDGCTACQLDVGFTCTGAPSVCRSTCGDGVKSTTEACDDSNTAAGDGCSTTCTIELGYACTGSPSLCTIRCGDGAKAASEGCDDGNTAAGDGCSASCTVEPSYVCTGTNPSLCRGICGDGVLVPGEACDDGNTVATDGCSATCTIGLGFTCTGTPSVCSSTCGDGLKASSEGCDDGNTTDGDGCTASCTVQVGWSCSGTSPSVCANRPLVCGDGFVDAPEQCDDGNTRNLDGCSATCRSDYSEVEPNEDGTPSTGGTGTTGNDFAVANANTNGARLASNGALGILAALTPAGDEDVFALKNDTTSPQYLRVDTWNRATGFGQGVSCGTTGIDTVLSLRSATGTSLVLNDERSSSDSCSAVAAVVAAGATVYASVIDYGDNSTIAAYGLQVRWAPIVCGDSIVSPGEDCDDGNQVDTDACSNTCTVPTEVEPNNVTSAADTVGVTFSGGSKTIKGTFGTSSDLDYFKVSVTTATVVRFETFTSIGDCDTSSDPIVSVWNASGTMLYADLDYSGINDCAALAVWLPAGTYYVRVENGDVAVPQFYYLEAAFQTPGGAEGEAAGVSGTNNTIATAENGLLTLVNGWSSGDHMLGADIDVWKVTVPAGKALRAELIEGAATTCDSENIDSLLTVKNAAGTTLASDDDSGRGYCSLVDGTGASPLTSGLVNGGSAAVTWYVFVQKSSLASAGAGKFVYRLQVTVR